jgi:hypothetical protein
LSYLSVRPSLRMEQLGSHWTDFYEIWYLSIFRKFIEKIQVSCKSDNNSGHFTWTPMHIFIYLAQLFLKWIIFRTKVVEKKHTSTMFSNFFFQNRAVYEIMWKNIVERGRPQMTIWRIRLSCWIPKAKNTHSEYVIFIVFPLQQWLHEHTSVLRTLLVLYRKSVSALVHFTS